MQVLNVEKAILVWYTCVVKIRSRWDIKNIKIRRLIALYIDFGLALLCPSILFDYLTSKIELLQTYNMLTIICIVLAIIICLVLFSIKDLIFRNASIGKKIVRLAIYYENGQVPNKEVIIKRILHPIFSNLFPLAFLGILFENKTSGDKKFKTIVSDYIQVKNK